MKHFTLLVAGLFFAGQLFSQCTDDRYRNFNYFPGSTVTNGVVYGNNLSVPPFGSSEGSPQVLKMDVYEPEGDVITNRPVVIVAYGGSFVTGQRSDVEGLCREFARLGFVAVAPDYRVGFFIPDEITTTLAVLRGSHDMKACVRFMRKSEAEDGNPYRIDSDMIFVGGVSAGAISAVHAAYLNELSETPSYLANDTAGLGGMEGISGSPGYSSVVNGVFSYSGAIGDTLWMTQNDVPIISFHEEGDGVVPYLTQEVSVQGIPTGLTASGSFDLHVRANNLGMVNCFTGYPGNGHVGYLGNGNYEEVLSRTADFLADIVCAATVDCGEVPYAEPSSINDLQLKGVSIYPNPTTGEFSLDATLAGQSITAWQMVDASGRIVLSGNSSGLVQRIDASAVDAGSYIVKVFTDKAIGNFSVIVE